MNDISSSDQLAGLPVDQRNQLESLLMTFDQSWSPTAIGDFARRAEAECSLECLRLAVQEMVKIDLQRGWSSGHGKRLEEYIEQLPALGSAEDIGTDLVHVEYTARAAADPTVELNSYAERFPRQFARLVEVANRPGGGHATVPPKVAPDQASIETSRIE